jgi:CheY-like chemotaxis protein
MNAVIGMSELVLREDLPQGVYENVHTIKQAGNNLLTLINDILDLSKIESGKLEIIPVEYNLYTLFSNVCALINTKMKETLTFTAVIDENLPVGLHGDETRIRQVLLNILSNAVKYTPEGFVDFHITGSVSDARLSLVATVSDSGIGIKSEDLATLFEEFSQYDTEKNRHIQGTGLGLSIAKKLCMAMEGDIIVTSEYGKGSTFMVQLTQEIHDYTTIKDAPKPQTGKHDATDYFTAEQANILIVDDIPTNLKVMEGLVAPYRVQVDVCESGERAIDLCTQVEYDIVFLDHMMPDMDGIEAASIIRQISDYYQTMPLVALTANALTGMREMYLENGFSDFLAKPVEMAKLHSLLATWIPTDKQTETTETAPIADNQLAIYEVFLDDAKKKLIEIPQCLETDEMRLFTICVHALKSASANVGEATLSRLAAGLETAASRGNNDYIKENMDDFINELKEVIKRTAALVDRQSDVVDVSMETLMDLKTALGTIDITVIDQVMAECSSSPAMWEVSLCVLNADYDGAIALIEKMMETHITPTPLPHLH